MPPIRHHPANRDALLEMLDTERANIELAFKSLAEDADPHLVGSSIQSAIRLAGSLAVLDPGSEELCAALQSASTLHGALFSLMLSERGESVISLREGHRAKVRNIGVTSETNVASWHVGFCFACMVRDRATLDVLARTPIDLLRSSSTTSDDCMYLWAEALQRWHLDETGAVASLQEALDATDPDQHELQHESYVLNMVVPQMQLLFRLISGEAGPFNDALTFAVTRHKKYVTSGRQKTHSRHYLALGPLAFASLAHDAGIAINVVSDYMPRHIVEGECNVGDPEA